MQINASHCVVLTLLVLLYVAFGRLARLHDRLSAAGAGVAVGGFLAFCLFYQVVPLRVSAYLAAPLAFLGTVSTGSILSARSLAPCRSLAQVGFSLFVIAVLVKSQISEPLTVSQNWRDIGLFIERAFPEGTRVWVGGGVADCCSGIFRPVRCRREGFSMKGLESGRLVAVEGFFKDDDEKNRLREDLPENVRFVTMPLRINYQRVFFVPPTPPRIRSTSVDNRPLNPWVSDASRMILACWQSRWAMATFSVPNMPRR